ncbi:MAG TPA: AIM24 family protein [Chloroflexota bacterium]|jgi:uncharacterized protein (AIM24 family)|nr:AIM24 family protein [Chloroflexota bacterium]
MQIPQILTTTAEDETYAGVTYHIRGELVPELAVQLDGGQTIFFEHHVALWKSGNIEIGMKTGGLKSAFKRKVAGLQILLTEAKGNGQIAFSRDGVGHVFAMHMQPGDVLETREHQYLAGTSNVEYSFTRVKGIGSVLFGGTGFFLDEFTCKNGPGIVWLHGYGNVLEAKLGDGEYLDIEPGGFLYKDKGVRLESKMQGIKTGLFGGSNIVWNRFTGPGRVGIQTMYYHLPTEE